MTLLAESTEGLHNLFRISSLASLEGQYRKYPRFDRDLLERHGTVADLVTAAARIARRACVVIPPARAVEVADALDAAGSRIRRRCEVDGSLVLLEGRRMDPGPVSLETISTREGLGWSPRLQSWYTRLGARLAPCGQCTSGVGSDGGPGGSTMRRSPK